MKDLKQELKADFYKDGYLIEGTDYQKDKVISTWMKVAVPYGYILEMNKSLLGQVLTIVDASISDKIQNKALKDIIKDKFHLSFDKSYKDTHTSDQIDNFGKTIEEGMPIAQIESESN